jgi:outer membrane protein assembly factor BamD (BamD/ComL family)
VVSRPLELLSVRGRSGRFVIHELLGIARSDDPELAASAEDIRLCELTAAAWATLAHGDATEAQRRYEAIQAEYPHDRVTRHLLAHALEAAHEPADGS